MSIKRLPTELVYAITDDGLDDKGYVLTIDPSTGHVKKATKDDVPFGIAASSTKNPVTGEVESGVEVAIIPVRTGFVVKVKKATGTGKSIAIGDYVGVDADTAGTVAKLTIDTTDASTLLDGLKKVVGIALEAAGEDADEVAIRLVGV